MHALRKSDDAEFSGKVPELRSKLRRCFKAALVRLARDKRANIWWTLYGYHRYLYVQRRLRLVGWPAKIPFTNLSNLKMAALKKLQSLWRRRKLRFERVSDDDFYKNATNPKAVAPAEKYDLGKPFAGRNDNKKSRFDHKTGQPISKKRKLRSKGATTPKYVTQPRPSATHQYTLRSRGTTPRKYVY